MKKCPQCAEEVRPDAKVCRYCGHRFGGDWAALAKVAAVLAALVFAVSMCEAPETGTANTIVAAERARCGQTGNC